MSSNTTGAYHGFSVVQPFLGAPLQWLPALGTQELDDMINTFLPGPASIQDKRSQISLDFFEYYRLTGENFKFYPVPATIPSPASSAAVYDSGYASNFNVSPVITESQWVESPSTFTAVSFDETSVRSPSSSSTSKRTASSSSKQRTTDFASHPGMRIMTKDGRDVTNSASRGCKTKEQRDHAHLMRIIKACDSCRKKKVRCDPSHKKRTASQASTAPVEQKSSKKSKKKAAAVAADPPPTSTNEFSSLDLELLNTDNFDISEFAFPTFETTPESVDDLWDQYVQQDPTLFAGDFMNYVPDDYSLFTDQQLGHVSSSSGSASTSPTQVYTPYTPTPPGPSPHTVVYENLPEISQGDPTLPYLNPGVPHGTDYVDFNLFSPPPDFLLDEEPQPVKKSAVPGRRQQHSRSPVSGYEILDNVAASSSSANVSQTTDGLVHSESPTLLQSSSSGLLRVSQFSNPALQTIASPAAVFSDYSPELLESNSFSQTSRGPDQQYIDGHCRPVLEGYEPFSARDGVRATTSRSELQQQQPQQQRLPGGVIVQSAAVVSAPVRRATGDNIPGGDVRVSPGLDVVASSSSAVRSTENAQAHVVVVVNSPHGLPGVSAFPTVSRRRGGVDSQTASSVSDVGLSPSANVNVSGSSGSGTNSQLVQCHSGVGVQQQSPRGLVPSGANVDVGSSLGTTTTTLLSTLPARRLLLAGGDSTKSSASSSLSLVYSQLVVVLGLVSYLLQQYMGLERFYDDIVNTLFMITTLSLATLIPTKPLSSSPSSSKSTTNPLVENVKSRVQAVGCQVRNQAGLFARSRRISLPRLASLSVSRF